ncbi:zinc-dependent peptidase [Erysipelotrichaceae bacterium RD49]|nr:zinc-dependent peptidase [Erysipelotrichaceae bacterium RD49]
MRKKQFMRKLVRADQSASTSALFLPTLLLGIVIFVALVFIMLLVTGLLPYWQVAIRYYVIWIMPLVVAVSFVLDLFLEKRRYSYMMWGTAIVILIAVQVKFLIDPPNQFAQLRYYKARVEEIERQNQEPLLADMKRLTDSKIPLYIETRNNPMPMDEVSQQYLVDLINGMPDFLTENVAGLYFVDEDEFRVNAGEKKDIDSFAGYVRLEQHAMYVNMHDPEEFDKYLYVTHDGRQLDWSDPEGYKETIVHELFHLLDIQYEGKDVFIAQSDEWQNLFNQYGTALSQYGATSPTEFFAEAGTYYYLYPELLRQKAEPVYQWFVNNLPGLQPEGGLAFLSVLDLRDRSACQTTVNRIAA